jgi:outer membrane protein assembly factor BamA
MHGVLPTVLVLVICATPAVAQEIRNRDTDETESSPPPQPADESWLKTTADWIKKRFRQDRPRNGFYAAFRGFPPGSGIAAGPGYRQDLFSGRGLVDASALASWSRGTVAQARFELPHLASDDLTVGAEVKRQDFTRINFFGVGPESRKNDHSGYALRNTDYLGFVTFRLDAAVSVGGQLGYSQPVTIGRPRATSHPSTEDVFSSDAAPAVSAQPAFLHGEVFVEVDTRNNPSRPTTGGSYRVSVSSFSDRDYNRFSFRRYEAETSQYIPTFNERGVIAVRARVTSSDTNAGNVVPFYLLPAVGGSRSLRGYSDYRFTDRNALLLNAEYRWRVHRMVDAAVFYDVGQVAPRIGALDFTSLKTSYGVGVRIISRTNTFIRIDVGHSNEGTRLFLSLGEVLRPGHRSILMPYVP